MARRRRKRPSAKSEDKTQAMRRTLASDAGGLNDDLSPAKHIASDDSFSEERGKRQKLEQRQEEAADKNGEQEHGDETDLLQDDVTLLTSLIYPGSADQVKQSLGQRSHPEEEEEEEEENESPILVTCDRNEGRLYLSKLRVVVNERCRTKCIRTGSTWWTPNEFQFVSGRGAAKDWKRTVKHNGQCLKTLLAKGTISLNAIPPKCFCRSCEHNREEGKASLSAVDQKEQQQELAPSLCSALETQDVADKKPVDGVKVESGSHEVKTSRLRTIKGHRRAKRDIKDIEDRKRRPSGLPVKKKLRNSRPEPVLDGVLEERQGHVEGLLDLQEVKDRQGSLIFRLSSSSFEHVIRSPNDVSSRSSNRLNSVSAFEGQCNDHDATQSVTIEAKAEQELPGNTSEEHSVCERPSDDVIIREPSKAPTSSQETKEEAHLNTGCDVGQPSSSSFASYQCNERAPEAPEAHVDAEPEANVAESASDDTSTATAKNSKGNVIGDGEDDVTGGAVSDVTSLTSSSPTASVTTATRRKSAYLSAVIEELKRRKRSREAEVIAPDASGGGGEGGGGVEMEGQKMTEASVTPSSLMISPMAESMKSEIDEKTDDDRTGVTCGPPPAESFDGLSDVMSSCLKPNPTGGGGGGGGGGVRLVHDHPETRQEKNSSGLRKSDPESSDRKKAFPSPSLHAAWPTTPSKVEADRKQEGMASSSDRKFGISRGKPEPRVTSSLETMTSPLNISHLASIYGLNASPLTSLPLSPLQFPFFPPYLFMGFPLHPLLPQFSSTSGASLPVAVPPVTSSTFGSSQQQKQRRMTQQSPCGGSSLTADHIGALLRPRPSASNSSSSHLHMMWRPLVTDFSSADQWTTGRPLATNASGSSKPHSGTARHPIWRPEMTPQSPSLRKYSQRSFEEKTIAQRPSVRAQKEAEMTSSVAANNRYKSEFLVPANVSRKLRSCEKEEEEEEEDEAGGPGGGRAGRSAPGAYSCDAQGVLDLSSK